MNWEDDPLLKHEKLTPREMAMICDVNNGGFHLERQYFDHGDEMVAASLRANVEDSFRLYPGSYEGKWEVNRESMIKTLAAMSLAELLEVANRVDAFWEQVSPEAKQEAKQ